MFQSSRSQTMGLKISWHHDCRLCRRFQSSRSQTMGLKWISKICHIFRKVSIQPKPDNGFKVDYFTGEAIDYDEFQSSRSQTMGLKFIHASISNFHRSVSIQPKPDNGFKALRHWCPSKGNKVSIQPKPDNGFKAIESDCGDVLECCFNPAEARQWV